MRTTARCATALIVAASAILAGCSGDSETSAPTTVAETPTTSVAPDDCVELAEQADRFTTNEGLAFSLAVDQGVEATEVKQRRYGNAVLRASLASDAAGCEKNASFECEPLPAAFDEFDALVISSSKDIDAISEDDFTNAAVRLNAAALTCLNGSA